MRLRRLKGMGYYGFYWSYFIDVGFAPYDQDYVDRIGKPWPFAWIDKKAVERGDDLIVRQVVWPWHFGWHSAQMHETFWLGPCYFCWCMK